MSQNVLITTFGCRANQSESDSIASYYLKQGYNIVSEEDNADLCIVNTCTVTAKTDLQCRNTIRSLKRRYTKAKIIVTGCYANVSPDDLKKITEIDEIVSSDTIKDDSIVTKRTRPQIKIQDGCNRFCSYCIVPYARGRSRSLTKEMVFGHLKQMFLMGNAEVVLTGIHLGAYGADLSPKATLLHLLKEIRAEFLPKYKFRIRLSSIDPDEVTDELATFIKENDFICRHLHIPLQSGSDAILKLMKRPYSTKEYKDLIDSIKTKVENISIGTDVIVGFPGEDERLFNETLNFLKELNISYLNVFPYSKRKLTAAFNMKETATHKEKQTRVKKLMGLSDQMKNSFYKENIGKVFEIVVETKRDKKTGLLRGFTSNYIPVLLDGGDFLMGKMAVVKIGVVDNLIVKGRLNET